MTEQPPHDFSHGSSDTPGPGDQPGQFSQRIRHEQVSARVPEAVSRGVFATGALVLNGPHEFIIDFIQSVSRPHQVVARIVLPTTIMQSMIRAMQQNFENYEQRFGPMPELPRAQGGEGGTGAAGGGVEEAGPEGTGPASPAGGAEKPQGQGGSAGGPAGGVGGGGLGAVDESVGGAAGGGAGEAAGEAGGDAGATGGTAGAGAGAGAGSGAGAGGGPSVEEIYGQLKLPDEVAVGSYANTVMITHSPAEFCFDFITSFYPRSTVTCRIFMAAAQVPRVHATLERSFTQFKQKVVAQRKRLEARRKSTDESGQEPGEGPGEEPPTEGGPEPGGRDF